MRLNLQFDKNKIIFIELRLLRAVFGECCRTGDWRNWMMQSVVLWSRGLLLLQKYFITSLQLYYISDCFIHNCHVPFILDNCIDEYYCCL